VSQRTLWEEGHESGRQVVVLGVALALTITALDLLVFGRLTVLFDIGFVLTCLALALLVRPSDFFTVGVLPPLLMVGSFVLVGVTRPDVIADATDGVVQAVVSGRSHHAGALIFGYALSLGVLAVRHRVLRQRQQARQAVSNRPGSPAPTRTTSG
jgi:mannose/fructose/N-acetylgalactosamine-specific phosphotransferase system component IIC